MERLIIRKGKTTMLLSVILPVFNTNKELPKCINSIINQTYRDLQIILIDDGSTDGSAEICDELSLTDCRIECYHTANKGLVSARKTGARYAKGEFIISVDSDDWMEKDYFERFVTAIEALHCDQVWSTAYFREYRNRTILCEASVEKHITDAAEQEYLLKKAKGEYGYCDDIPYFMWTKCIRKDLFIQIYESLNDEISYHEDGSFSVRILANNSNAFFINNAGYHYVQRDSSMAHMPLDSLDKLALVRNSTLDYLKSVSGCVTLKKVVEGAYICALVTMDFAAMQSKLSDELVPFSEVKYGSRIILFGLGNVGRKIYEYLTSTPDYILVGVTDNRDQSEVCKDFCQPNEIDYNMSDYIVVATVKKNIADQISAQLIGYGVLPEKIKTVFDKLD